MKCLAVSQNELIIRTLAAVLQPSFEVEFLVETKVLARRLHDAGLAATVGDPRRVDTYLKADITPNTCIILEDNGRRSPKRLLEAVRDAGGALIYVLATGAHGSSKRAHELRVQFPDAMQLDLVELVSASLLTELGRSLTRAKVLQYQRYFADADRILILLHNDPDPDAMASGLALRNLLRRTKTTAIIGAVRGVTRPENIRMANLLDIHVEPVTPESFNDYDRVATVDVQPHYFGDQLSRVDLVVDHHPEQPGYGAVFKDIRAGYGSTCTILTEHLRAGDVNISERVATAMLYAIKSDTLFLSRHTNRVDLDAFTFLYPLADAALIRKMEGAKITADRLGYVVRAHADGIVHDQVFTAFLGDCEREDFITYTADFLLQLEDVNWTAISGVVNDSLIVSVRNLGYSRNAGEFVRRSFSELGSAGGHRAMAKAVVPVARYRDTYGTLEPARVAETLHELVGEFLHEPAGGERRKEPLKA